MCHPLLQVRSPLAGGKAFDSVTQFRKCNNAEEGAILVSAVQPRNHASIGAGLNPLGYDVGIQQKTHRLTLRGRPGMRLSFKPELRRGDAAKKSAKVPLRLVLRSHSSAATTNAVFCPFRVMVWGPLDCARSNTSLNLAFASATVHVWVSMHFTPLLWST